MPNPEISSIKQFFLTCALVILGGVVAVASWQIDQPEVVKTEASSPVRFLASEASPSGEGMASSQTYVELSAEFCRNLFEKKIIHPKNFIQLSGPWCRGVDLSISYGKSQYRATLLPISAKKFLTDVIPLEAGENILTIQGQDSQGKTFTSRLIIEHKL